MDEIVYYDRYRDQKMVEKVYGDKALRWTYGTLAGRASLNALVKRAAFSHWYGWRMDQPATKGKIAPFIETYDLDASEFLEPVDRFENFNQFFYRRLKPEARPIASDSATAVFPADGRHLCVPDLSNCDGLFVKGEMFNLSSLLGDENWSKQYRQGSLLISRLCPVDYHRFHFPVSGIPSKTKVIKGSLYSVNPIALRRNIEILATNKRCITELETNDFGKVLILEIGATCVGGIIQTYVSGGSVNKGDEKGYFRFGGSCTMVMFPPGRVQFSEDLIENSAQNRELYARMGDRMATRMDQQPIESL